MEGSGLGQSGGGAGVGGERRTEEAGRRDERWGGSMTWRVIVGNNYPQQLPVRVIVGATITPTITPTITLKSKRGLDQERS